jgi:hypothetical protein
VSERVILPSDHAACRGCGLAIAAGRTLRQDCEDGWSHLRPYLDWWLVANWQGGCPLSGRGTVVASHELLRVRRLVGRLQSRVR